MCVCTARHSLNTYLGEVLGGTVSEVLLKGDGRPPGVLKTLLIEHGDDLDTLRVQTQLASITIDYRK